MIATIGAMMILFAMILYALMALGFPVGEYAMGGRHKIIPDNRKIICWIALGVQLIATMIILQAGGVVPMLFPENITRWTCLIFAGIISLSVILNFFSHSSKERWTTGPMSLIAATCLWLTGFAIDIA